MARLDHYADKDKNTEEYDSGRLHPFAQYTVLFIKDPPQTSWVLALCLGEIVVVVNQLFKSLLKRED